MKACLFGNYETVIDIIDHEGVTPPINELDNDGYTCLLKLLSRILHRHAAAIPEKPKLLTKLRESMQRRVVYDKDLTVRILLLKGF